MISKFSIVNKYSILGQNCVIEPFTIIGHPELWNSLDFKNSEYDNIDDFFLLKKCQVSIGENSIIRSGSVFYENVNIGMNFQCGSNVIIRSLCLIGDNVYVKNNSEIMRNVIISNNCRIAGIVCDYTKMGNNVYSYGTISQ